MSQQFCPYCMTPLQPDAPSCPHCGRDPSSYTPDSHHLRPGTVLMDRYVLGRALGAGGFGITYIAYDTRLALRVAIKEYFPTSMVGRDNTVSTEVHCYSGAANQSFAHGRDRFIKEARVLAQMNKIPEIVGVQDFFEANGTAYIVMEYIAGTTLKDLVTHNGGRLPAPQFLNLVKPLFGALDALHKQGLIHRDISPDNLMMENGRIRLLDLGCARESVHGTETLTVIMKQGFSPLEQYQNKGQGPWTDMYALAATIYYCVTGKIPPQPLDRLVGEELVPPRKLGAALTEQQEKAILWGLSIQPADRPQSAEAFYKALYSAPSQPIPPTAPVPSTPQTSSTSPPPLPPDPILPRWKVFVPILLVALILILGAVLAGSFKSCSGNPSESVSPPPATTAPGTTGEIDLPTNKPNEGTSQPTAQSTPEPTPETNPTQTAESTQEPPPSSAAESTAVPSAAPSVSPSNTPTPQPTLMPTSEPTPAPTATPVPANTPEPTSTPTPTGPTTGAVLGYEYEIHDGKYVVITGFTGDSTDGYIPDQIDNLPVTEIADYAFSGVTIEGRVRLPHDLEHIGSNVFQNCRGLYFILAQSDFTMESDSFAGCPLQDVVLSDRCKGINWTASGDYRLIHFGDETLYGAITTVDYDSNLALYAVTDQNVGVLMDVANTGSDYTVLPSIGNSGAQIYPIRWIDAHALDYLTSKITITLSDDCIFDPILYEKAEWNASSTSLAEMWRLSNETAKQVNEMRPADLPRMKPNPDLVRAAMIRAEECTELFGYTRPNGSDGFTVLDDLGISYQDGFETCYDYFEPAHPVLEWYPYFLAITYTSPISDGEFAGHYLTDVGVAYCCLEDENGDPHYIYAGFLTIP